MLESRQFLFILTIGKVKQKERFLIAKSLFNYKEEVKT